MAGGLKLRIKKVEGLYYLCSENKGAVQLRVTYVKSRFSHDAAHLNFHLKRQAQIKISCAAHKDQSINLRKKGG